MNKKVLVTANYFFNTYFITHKRTEKPKKERY